MVNILQITLFMSIFGYTWCITCSEVTDCIACVSMKSWIPLIDVNCRWCPLSGTCHAYGSLANTCSLSTSVTKTAFCYEKRYGEYDPENAYINAMLSAVAYSDHPRKCFDKMFPRGGFKLVKAIGKRCEYLFEYRECFAVVAVSDHLKLIVIAYRGTTDGTQLAEEIGTFILPNQQFVAGGTVHRYFYDAFNELYPCARIHMRKLIASKPKYDVLVTGHSLGAAMASLMAASLVYDNPKLEQRMYLYTFGMPRLGDQTYAVTHDRLVNNSWRVIHYKDFVTRVPPRAVGNFHHKTEVYYDVENMLPDSPYTVCSSNEDPKCSVQHVLNPLDYANYINYHTHYFSIQLGQVCKSLGAGRRRRSEDGEEMSAMSHLFNNETCKVIEFDDVTSGQRGIHLAPQLLVAVSFVFFIVVLA